MFERNYPKTKNDLIKALQKYKISQVQMRYYTNKINMYDFKQPIKQGSQRYVIIIDLEQH
jgi:hypothetical protein